MKKTIILFATISFLAYYFFYRSSEDVKETVFVVKLENDEPINEGQKLLQNKNLQSAFKKIVDQKNNGSRNPASVAYPPNGFPTNPFNPNNPNGANPFDSSHINDQNKEDSRSEPIDDQDKKEQILENFRDDIAKEEAELANLMSQNEDDPAVALSRERLESKKKYLEYLETLQEK